MIRRKFLAFINLISLCCISGFMSSTYMSLAVRTLRVTFNPIRKNVLTVDTVRRFSTLKDNQLSNLYTINQEICNTMERSVLTDMFKHKIGKYPTKCLLSVSGGSDSMAMLHILRAIKETYKTNISLEIVNFNHKIRPESDEEALFVGAWAEKYGLPYHAIVLPEHLRVESGFQQTARDWRRRECERIVGVEAHSGTAAYICTGHNSDDQNETMMLKLLRGVHLSNFQPMKAVDGLYFRPILGLTKQQIEQYLTLRGLEWREDASNQTRDYKRNQVRLDLLPLMAQLAGGKAALSTRFAQLAQQSEDLQEWIEQECQRYNLKIDYHSTPPPDCPYRAKMTFSYPDAPAAMPKLVVGELVRRWVHRSCDIELTAERVESLVETVRTPLPHGRASRTVTVSKHWNVVRTRRDLQLRRRIVPEKYQHRT